MNRLFSWGIIAWIVSAALLSETVGFGQEGAQVARVEEVESQREFEATIGPWLKTYCAGCHNEETRESGIRLDHLDGSLPEDTLRLWEGIRAEVVGNKMPPEDEPQPTSEERKSFVR